MPLIQRVDGPLRIDFELFSRGGLAILDAIEAGGYNTLQRRPELTKWNKLRLLGRALASRTFSRTAPHQLVQGPGTDVVSPELDSKPEVRKESIASPDAEVSADATVRLHDPETVSASYAECNRIARASHSSFYLAFFGLPREKRNALCALYAFMRLVDDVSDEPGDLDSKRAGLARWRAMLDEAIAGRTSGHAVLPALADTISRFEIPSRYFHDLILGAEMDLTVASYATFDRLSEYCYRVAGTVGLTCLHVFGFRDPRAPDLAERLGLAFQLTNILRDVSADHQMGRVYLPLEDLDLISACARMS